MAYTLPELDYDYNALEPYIDARTMEIHYTKHHQAYIDGLNKTLEGHDDLLKLEVNELLANLDKVPSEKRQSVINFGGGHANHSFFWKVLTKPSESKFEFKSSNFKDLFTSSFGSYENFKNLFTERAMSVFGSGWCFLIKTKDGELILKRHSFQNSPVMHGNTPLLGIDLWEHAYYLNYQNKKKDYIDAFFSVVNWDQVEANYQK